MIPMYMYYSMFGFQRNGDIAWAAGDAQAQGFLLGATAGRTTLNGEGLQHQDGHSHILANTIPGKGVSFMERNFNWHGKPPTQAEAEKALAELTTVLNSIPYAHDPA